MVGIVGNQISLAVTVTRPKETAILREGRIG